MFYQYNIITTLHCKVSRSCDVLFLVLNYGYILNNFSQLLSRQGYSMIAMTGP